MDNFFYGELPSFLEECAQIPVVKRLQKIGMNCGCEYTSFPVFRNLKPYTRYDHSLGAALIIWHFTADRAQAAAGLLHDIATPVFAHVVDFMNGDYLKQESTEAGTAAIIASSPELQSFLERNSLTTLDVCDYHRYPIADNDTPQLSADRLEYSFGNMVNFGICTEETAKLFYEDLTVGSNEKGQKEIMFQTQQTAEEFAMAALQCSQIYVSDEDRYAMQILSEILRYAVGHSLITRDDLHSTEEEVIRKLLQDEHANTMWKEFRSYGRIVYHESEGLAGKWRKIDAKKRFIDPMVKENGRLSQLSPDFRDALHFFLQTDFDYRICAVPETDGIICPV